jgi:uncharacterized protein (TIGR03067 family)
MDKILARALLVSIFLTGQAGARTVVIHVTYLGKKAAVNVKIIIRPLDNSTPIASGVTDANGDVTATIPEGMDQVKIRAIIERNVKVDGKLIPRIKYNVEESHKVRDTIPVELHKATVDDPVPNPQLPTPGPRKDLATLNGLWALTSAVRSGEKMSAEEVKGIHLVLANGRYVAAVGDQTDEGTYKIDESKTPNTLTFTGTKGPNKGKTMLAIYELEDQGTLKICYDLSGKAFPGKFESNPDSQSFLATYERQQKRRGGTAPKKPVR